MHKKLGFSEEKSTGDPQIQIWHYSPARLPRFDGRRSRQRGSRGGRSASRGEEEAARSRAALVVAAGDSEDDPRGRRWRWPAVAEAAGRSLLRPPSCAAEAADTGVGDEGRWRRGRWAAEERAAGAGSGRRAPRGGTPLVRGGSAGRPAGGGHVRWRGGKLG